MLTVKQKKEHKGTANLKPYKKGQSGNPKGRPKKGSAIADILNQIGDETIQAGPELITKREAVMRKIFAEAVKGNMAAIHFIADRTEGKALERILKQETDELVILE